jgi:DNA modification methylase
VGKTLEIRDRIVELRRIKARDLLPHTLNPRLHGDAQKAAVSILLREIGYADALLAYTTEGGSLRLIDGHLRRGLTPDTEVPVLVTDLTEAEAALMLAAGDPLAAMAERDDGLMVELLQQADTDLLAELLEGGGDTLAELLGRGEEVPEGGLLPGADADALPETQERRCKAGEIWALGSHRLFVGDCTDPGGVALLMNGERAKLLVADPPYAVDYVEKARDMNRLGYGHSRGKSASAIEGDGLDEKQAVELWRAAFCLSFEVAVEEAAALYVWHDPRRAGDEIAALLAQMGVLHHQTMVWVKENFVLGRCDYQGKHEPCFYGWKQGHRPPFYGAKNQTTVWEVSRDAGNKPLHPTQKPVAVFEMPMRNHLKPGEIAYDPFVGSGTTFVAAEACGVRAFCCEVSEKHADTCLARWESVTGRSAERLEAG